MILRKALSALAIGVTCWGSALAQNVINDKTATVVSYWNTGDTRSYRMDRKKTGERQSHTSVVLDVKVLATTETSNTLEVRYRDMNVLSGSPTDPKSRQAAERVIKMVDGMRVVVSTSETGVVNEVTNGEELKRHCDKIVAELIEMGNNPEEKKAIGAMMRKTITVDALEMSALEDLGLLLYPFGVEYKLGEEQLVDSELQSPLGGDPLPAKVSLRMTKLDPAGQTCSIHVDQRIDPSQVMSILDAGGEKTDTEISAEERAELEALLKDMKVNDVYDFDLDLSGAWVSKATCSRSISLMGSDVTDQRTFTLQ